MIPTTNKNSITLKRCLSIALKVFLCYCYVVIPPNNMITCHNTVYVAVVLCCFYDETHFCLWTKPGTKSSYALHGDCVNVAALLDEKTPENAVFVTAI